ncbi:hypothetical protein [Streptomyces sp. MP131-18]|uniref:hypothetical protein n=1 Tax=Streptomyces sp. MP131-18 TaxID=1857892 RepID=UPI00097C0421|nr:hypothetical protein [Streptomyces sp. MP131-18]ONK09301.1 hypothetical protein STBA_71560 [Streptomyces sp. MP131-18]
MPTYPGHAYDFSDRITAVLRGLTENEQTVALAWATTGDSWENAAIDAGLPATHGERVRRKLKRLGTRHISRATAAADTTGRRR